MDGNGIDFRYSSAIVGSHLLYADALISVTRRSGRLGSKGWKQIVQ